jgi:hypothetical protein
MSATVCARNAQPLKLLDFPTVSRLPVDKYEEEYLFLNISRTNLRTKNCIFIVREKSDEKRLVEAAVEPKSIPSNNGGRDAAITGIMRYRSSRERML